VSRTRESGTTSNRKQSSEESESESERHVVYAVVGIVCMTESSQIESGEYQAPILEADNALDGLVPCEPDIAIAIDDEADADALPVHELELAPRNLPLPFPFPFAIVTCSSSWSSTSVSSPSITAKLRPSKIVALAGPFA
jgi:hypothetical protein